MTFNTFNLNNHFNSITSNINNTLNINLSNSLSIFITTKNDYFYNIFITKYIFTNNAHTYSTFHLFSTTYQISYDNLTINDLYLKLNDLQSKYSIQEYKLNQFFED